MNLLRDALLMIRDIGKASRVVNIWGALLNVPQLIGGLVFITTAEGQLVLATLILTLVVAGQIHKKTPFSRLIGLCHLPWLALLPWLIDRLLTIEHPVQLQVWGYYVAATISISLVFDVLDVYRYAKGQRTFSWASKAGSAQQGSDRIA
ncbi:MAG: hypothetical protein AMJ67_12580 [Betaproteobacteria bacterium SG8_41]|nr:MAG: hypothetical protein AMJ67_12580 [Betaproteobacteria bacterium SG8_41]